MQNACGSPLVRSEPMTGRRRALGRVLAMAALLAAPLACSFFVDTSGLATGDVIVVAGEGGAPEAAAAPEGGAEDAGRDASPASTCTAAHAFCADFEGDDYRAGWDSIDDTVPGGTLGTSAGAFEVGKGFRATLPRRDAVKGYASLGTHVPTAVRRAVVEFDVKLDPTASQQADSTVGLICAEFYIGSAHGGICFGVGPGFSPFGTTNGPSLETGRWVHGHLELDPVSQTASATIGSKTYASPWVRPAGAGAPQLFVQLGVLGYNVPAPPVGVTFDNVVVDFP